MKRRDFVKAGLAASAVGAAGTGLTPLAARSESARPKADRMPLIGNINQSVCQWCYSDIPIAELAVAAAEIGLKSVELLEARDWKAVTDAGLICAMAFPSIPDSADRLTDGFNTPENHAWLIPDFTSSIPLVAEAGFPNIICFSGDRRGISDARGLANCARGLREIMPIAEEHGVTVCMELLNSRVDHIDYQCDRTEWGLALVDAVGSDRFKLLYDIYHMQIMEGDVIRTIRNYHTYIGHYHTGGNPGRNEIDESQELYYPAIMEAILETGFEGYVAQEFIPTRDPLTSLAEGVAICDV